MVDYFGKVHFDLFMAQGFQTCAFHSIEWKTQAQTA